MKLTNIPCEAPSTSRCNLQDLSLHSERLNTFTSWPIGIKQRPDELAAAGFYYTGCGDELVCFSCGSKMCQLEPDDNPWVEHQKLLKRSNKNCAYLDSKKKIVEFKQCDQLKSETTIQREKIGNECSICLNHISNIAIIPCGHVAVCSQCFFGIGWKCPICRGNITGTILLIYS